MPLDELIYEISKDGEFSKLAYISACDRLLRQGYDFPCAWQNSIITSDLPLKNDEKEKLVSLGNSIGKTDSEGQKSILKIYYDMFLALSKKADEEKEKYSSTAFLTCFLFGCALFILTI